MTLNEKQYEYLEQVEDHLKHAVNENYFRIVNRNMLLEFHNIYKDIFKSDSKILNGCSRCILADIKRLATVYFKDKEEKNSIKSIEEPVEEPVEEEAPKKMSQYSYGKKTTKTNATKTKKTNNKKK